MCFDHQQYGPGNSQFDLNPTAGPRSNQLIFHNDAINVGQGDSKFKYMGMELPLATADAESFCIKDVMCVKEAGEINDNPSTNNNDNLLDPTTKQFIYDSKLTYYCGKARAFEVSAGNTVTQQDFTCSWEGQWSPSGTLMSCICK